MFHELYPLEYKFLGRSSVAKQWNEEIQIGKQYEECKLKNYKNISSYIRKQLPLYVKAVLCNGKIQNN